MNGTPTILALVVPFNMSSSHSLGGILGSTWNDLSDDCGLMKKQEVTLWED
jgi:hypothetical protein